MVPLVVGALSQAHTADAARLLAAAQRAGSSDLTSVAGNVDEAARIVFEAGQRGPGVVATDGGSVLGFVVLPSRNGSRLGRLRISDIHHAADPARARSVYRALYEAIAAQLVSWGALSHRILVLAQPAEPVAALFEMGFGVDQIKGVRPVAADLRSADRYLVEPADVADAQAVVELWAELIRFHSEPPILERALPFDPAVAEADVRSAVHDESRALFVARQSGKVVGMIEGHPDRRYFGTMTIGLNVVTKGLRFSGVGTAMLGAVLRWGAVAGFHHCAVGWASANLVSDAFYRGHGFVPVRYELVRNIDGGVNRQTSARGHQP
jgi:GNAT superfamily N-acetyltransferase